MSDSENSESDVKFELDVFLIVDAVSRVTDVSEQPSTALGTNESSRICLCVCHLDILIGH